MEECAEVQKVAAKALRFGLDDGYADKPTNQEELSHELTDLFAVAQMLEELGHVKIKAYAEDTQKKKDKVAHWMKYAQERGTLHE
jgi:NTP pyrophosphatase (non-canonical NTP hydrolase)